mgnify:CR=1 FL=1
MRFKVLLALVADSRVIAARISALHASHCSATCRKYALGGSAGIVSGIRRHSFAAKKSCSAKISQSADIRRDICRSTGRPNRSGADVVRDVPYAEPSNAGTPVRSRAGTAAARDISASVSRSYSANCGSVRCTASRPRDCESTPFISCSIASLAAASCCADTCSGSDRHNAGDTDMSALSCVKLSDMYLTASTCPANRIPARSSDVASTATHSPPQFTSAGRSPGYCRSVATDISALAASSETCDSICTGQGCNDLNQPPRLDASVDGTAAGSATGGTGTCKATRRRAITRYPTSMQTLPIFRQNAAAMS